MEQIVLNGRYALEQKIGEGGMAAVYRARDVRLNRRVAVKILHQHYANDPDFLKRFQHEAQAAAIFNHPNVVNVYDVGQDGSHHYIVMEYVDGINLKTLINREGPLLVANAVHIAEEIATGLEAAHRVGLIHRDVKPQNILVTPDTRVRITDFGIAKSYLSTAKTQTGMTFGTADYISPEQAQGQPASPQSDIYSLGVTLYEMLTGRLPFTGDSPVSVAMHHVSSPPPPIRQYNAQVPPTLEALVFQAMAKDPAQRPASARDFAQMLRTYRNRADQQTMVNPAPLPEPSAHALHRPPSGPATSKPPGTTPGRGTIPAPRSAVGKAPQQQGPGCGIFVVGMLVLVGVVSLVLLFSTGSFDSLLAGFESRPTSTPTLNALTPTSLTEATVTPSPTSTPVPLVSVPSVVGMTEQDARHELQQHQLVPVNDGTPRHHESIPAGAVIEQLVPAYTELPQGQPVTYTLSLGTEVVVVDVPDLTARRLESARSEAEGLGLLVEVSEEPSTTVSEGFIIRQEPATGMRLEAGETIHLYVSVGDKVWMPDLMGISEEEATLRLEATDGLFLSFVDQQGYDKLGTHYYEVLPGTVVSTIPDKDQWVPRGTGVTLGVRAYE